MDELQEKKSAKKIEYQTLSNLNSKNVMRQYHITYLHGRYDEEKIILKTCDYMKYYQSLNEGKETVLESVLKEIYCQQKAIVFVGFSFGDRFVLQTFERGFRDMLEKAKSKQETKNLSPKEVKHYALIEDPIEGGEDRERWLFDNINNIQEATTDWRDLKKVKERTDLEKRLKEINTEVIRYTHERHVEIEPYFKGIYNKRRSVKDFTQL